MNRKRLLKQAVIPALAKPGDPLVTAFGSIVKPEKSKKKDVTKDQPEITSRNFEASKKRTLQDLPATPPVISGCAAVFMYSMLGLSDREIAQAIKCTLADVTSIRDHPAYAECFSIVSKEFISANSALISARIAAYAHDAVTKIADISQNGKEENALRASVHIHDHAVGAKAGPNAQQGGNNVNELRIVILDREEKPVHVEMHTETINGVANHD